LSDLKVHVYAWVLLRKYPNTERPGCMGCQGPGRVWGSAPLGEPGGLPEKIKFLTLSVYDFKQKKKKKPTVCISIFCGTFFLSLKTSKY
jgi:hypothetical protein